MSRPRVTPSRPRTALLALAAAATTLSPALAVAQQGAEDGRRERIEASAARLDSLTAVYHAAQARASAQARAKVEVERTRATKGTDTLQVGPLRIVVFEGEADKARPYFEKAWEHYAPMLDGRAPAAVSDRLFAFQLGTTTRPMNLPPTTRRVFPRIWSSRESVEGYVRRAVGQVLAEALPEPQGSWSNRQPIGFMPDLRGVYRQLVVGRSETAARCREGDLEACWSAMGATGSGDLEGLIADLRLWYTPDQRRRLVEATTRPYGTRGRAAEWLACVEGGQQAACDRFLVTAYSLLIPLDRHARASLAMVALDMGGDGALARFAEPVVAPSGSLSNPRDLLARTAGTDADAVMAEWLRRVAAVRPDRAGLGRGERFLAFLWILFFVALSTRSTRWRLG